MMFANHSLCVPDGLAALWLRWAVLGVMLAAIALGGAAAQQKGKQKSRNQAAKNAAARARQEQQMVEAAQRQIAAAKRVLEAAESKGSDAEARLDAALSKMRSAADDFRDAQSQVRQLAKELAEIESDLLEEQLPDSTYGKAAVALESARQKMQQIEARILADPAARRQLEGLEGTQLAEAKTGLYERSSEYAVAKTEFKSAADEVSRVRGELFKGDQDWRAASAALSQARKEEDEAELKSRSVASGRTGSSQSIRSAADAAAAARATIARAEAVIRAHGKKGQDNKANSGKKNDPKRKT